MDHVVGRARRRRKVPGYVAAALVIAASILQPQPAHAEHGAGGSHGGAGGAHGGSGGFHGSGGLHAGGGFHGGEFRSGEFHGGGFHRGFGGARAGFALGLGGLYAPFAWDYYYPYADSYGYGYPDYGYSPSPAQFWYYCSDPAGYYPYVTGCNTGWQAVPPG